MDKPKIIKLDYGFRAYECDSFYEKLDGFLTYKPSNLGKSKLEKALKDTIKFVVIDAGLWDKLVAFWKKRTINLSYGFYDIDKDCIFINIRTCGISASKECKINTVPSTSTLKRLSEIVAHEFIHYKFQHDTFKVLDKVKPTLITFYKSYWENIVDESILQHVYRAHYYVVINTNKNILDPTYGRLTQIQLQRFVRILENILGHHKDKVLRPQTLSDTIETIKSFMGGYLFSSDFVSAKILKSYKRITGDFPPRIIHVGQELLYASEVLSICANIKTSKSYEIVRKILNA